MISNRLKHLEDEMEGLTEREKELVHYYIVGAASCRIKDADWISIVDRAIHATKIAVQQEPVS